MQSKQVLSEPLNWDDPRPSESFRANDEQMAAQTRPGVRKPVASVRPERSFTEVGAAPVAFEPLLDLQEAAAVLGMHWKTLEAKARGHEIPAFKVGKRWRFRLSSLNRWLEHGLNSNTTDQAVLTR